MTPTPRPVDEQLADLHPYQRRLLDRLRVAYMAEGQASEAVMRLVVECQEAGITPGLMGPALGVSRQNLYMRLRNWRKAGQGRGEARGVDGREGMDGEGVSKGE